MPIPQHAGTPRFLNDEAFKCLRVGDVDGYHRTAAARDVVDLSGSDLRATDFRRIDLSKLVLKNAYLRDVDFRGCDLRHLDLEGASLHNAKVAGAYFPESITSGEIQLSLIHGTRLRAKKPSHAADHSADHLIEHPATH